MLVYYYDIFTYYIWKVIISKLELLSFISVAHKYGHKVIDYTFDIKGYTVNAVFKFDKEPDESFNDDLYLMMKSIGSSGLIYRSFLCIGSIIINNTIYIFNKIRGV